MIRTIIIHLISIWCEFPWQSWRSSSISNLVMSTRAWMVSLSPISVKLVFRFMKCIVFWLVWLFIKLVSRCIQIILSYMKIWLGTFQLLFLLSFYVHVIFPSRSMLLVHLMWFDWQLRKWQAIPQMMMDKGAPSSIQQVLLLLKVKWARLLILHLKVQLLAWHCQLPVILQDMVSESTLLHQVNFLIFKPPQMYTALCHKEKLS